METKLTFVADTTAVIQAVKELTLELQRDIPGNVRQRLFDLIGSADQFFLCPIEY